MIALGIVAVARAGSMPYACVEKTWRWSLTWTDA
jgi:hypothetical protein